jgi:hypothetical protein
MAKRPVSELIELALIFAIQDREGMADALHKGPDRDEALALAKEFRAYHKRRFRREHLTVLERMIANSTTVTLDELRARGGPNRDFGADAASPADADEVPGTPPETGAPQ